MSIQAFQHIMRYKWVYLLTFFACGLVSIITYKSLTKEYSSIAHVFATNSLSPSKVLTEPNAGSQDDALRYGDKESIEQTLQLFLSNDLKLDLIKKYQLAKYWDVNETEVYKLFEKWDQDVKINITGLISIKIQVYHADPQIANAIAIDIINGADKIKRSVNEKTLNSTLLLLSNRLKEELTSVLNITFRDDKIDSIFNANRNVIQQKLSKNDLKRLLEIYYKFKDANANLNQSLPASFVISKPVPNSGEQRPRFILLFALITLSTLLLEFFIITFIEKLNQKK
jgi:hypothetical protein